jgi:hypothetical protein
MRAFVGTRKGMFTLRTNQRGHWSVDAVDFLGEPVTAIVATGGSVVAGLGTGHFGTHLWRDDGSGWNEIAAPEYPRRPDDADDVSPFTQEPWPWTVQLAWVLEAGHRDHPGQLWCGTIPGGLFRSDDLGASWELNLALWDHPARREWLGGGYDWPGVHTVSPDPRAPDSLLVGVSCGGAWVSDDCGTTWEVTAGMRNEYLPPDQAYHPFNQDPHRLARCAADPDVVWNQHHNGCFRSVDGGRSWTEIERREPSVFGFAVAAHPSDPSTAWFVPAVKDELRVPVDGQLAVSRTTDGGASFDVLTNGLPGPHAYDLVYRHALDVDVSGEHLLMGSTTGSLWSSGNGGDRWELVTANLPPVNVVRIY